MSRPLCFYTRGTTCAPCGANSEEGFVTTNNQTRIDTIADLTIRPLADRVIVEPAAAETKTASGIIIPDTAQEKPQRGIVRAVGNGKKDEPMTVKVGDTVLYAKYAGSEIKYEGTDFLIMRESDILAII